MATKITPKSSPAAVLKRARELIEQGWVQGDWRVTDDNGKMSFCAIGALNEASTKVNWETKDEARELLGSALRNGYHDVIEYNDADGRRKADVLKLFDRAIKAASKKGTLRKRA